MKILILRFSSIGDIVLTTPVVRCLKKKYPNAEVHYCTKKNFTGLLVNNPYIDRVISLDGSVNAIIREINATSYDLVLDLHNNLRTMLIKASLPKKTKIKRFQKINFRKLLAVKFGRTHFLPAVHIVDRYLKTIAFLGIENDGEGLDYFLPENLDHSFFTLEQKPFVAIAIGAQFATKQLPVHKVIDVCNSITHPIVLLGGKEDVSRAEEIQQHCSHVHSFCGQLSLDQSAWVVKQAHVVLTNDTGLMHIAAAFQKKIVSVWGNTIPEFGMYPYLPHATQNFTIEQVSNLSCRPCSKIGYQTCPKGHFKCMEEQNSKAIAESILGFLNS